MNWGWEKNKKRKKSVGKEQEWGVAEEEEEMKTKRQPEQKEVPLGHCHQLFIEPKTAPYPVPARSDRRPV